MLKVLGMDHALEYLETSGAKGFRNGPRIGILGDLWY